ncbi:MAG: NERD domain-containing protein [Anaerolineales bacterium]|nr:NERD domain-containing protein [Anaerolineales bacterium]
MIVLRDEARIARLRRVSQLLSLVGFLALVVGLIMAFLDPARYFIYQLVALLAGWVMSQIGVSLGHRYVRRPRPDEVLDKEVKPAAKDGRMYHYLLPAPHVLLTPHGVILFVAKFQSGVISVDNDKWRQRGIGLRRFFGGESLGNPTREAQMLVGALANYIRKHAPEVEEVPIAPVIVFTSLGTQELEIGETSVPVVHFKKLKGFLRQQRGKGRQPELSAADYAALKRAFDEKASHLLEQRTDELDEAMGA